jgi:hypothetical protein
MIGASVLETPQVDDPSVRDPSLPEIYPFGALLEIALHRFRDPGTKFHIEGLDLIPKGPKDYTYLRVNCAPVVRWWEGDGKLHLRAVSYAVNLCMHYYLLENQNPEMHHEATVFFNQVFLPGLTSLKTVYAGSCLLDTVKLWETMVKEGLKGHILYPIAKDKLESGERDLLSVNILNRINDAFLLKTHAGFKATTEYGRDSGVQIITDVYHLKAKLLKAYREYRQKKQ